MIPMKTAAVCTMTAWLLFSPLSFAQGPPPNSQLDPEPYRPGVDPDIDMFIGHWKDSMPRNIHGSLVVRDILTRCEGDPLHPSRKGACLTELKSVSYATLEPRASTTPSRLEGEQELYYILSGRGVLESAGKRYELREGIGIVVPPRVEFSMTAEGGEPLTMYLVVEPLPEGFEPKKEVSVRYEYDNEQGMYVHWANIDRSIIGRKDGTAVIGGFTSVKIDPMTMAQPHSHDTGIEEVWLAVKGDIKLLLGKQLRSLPVGSAYKIPANGTTPHANINLSGGQVKLIHMMNSGKSRYFPYAQLNPKQFDPAVDPDIDMFMGHWKDSMPRNIHGSLVVRDILVRGNGDPMKPERKGACLTDLVSVSRATLEPHAHTGGVTLEKEQEIFYVQSGRGTMKTRGKTVELREGIAVLVPPGVEYSMECDGGEHLIMYMVVEPVPPGFEAKSDIVVKDEFEIPGGHYSHWVYNGRNLFGRRDGLAVLTGIGPITMDAMTFGHPHSHGEGVEEVWIALEGRAHLLLGKQLREMPPGTAYKIPPNGTTPHANINASRRPVKLMWMMKVPGK